MALVMQARRLVAYSNGDFAELTGVSRRTVEWYVHNGGIRTFHQTDKLIAALVPAHLDLARRLADATGQSLEARGLVASAPPAATPSGGGPVREVRREHADSVLLAAANELHLMPEDLRAALAAAVARAAEMGVSAAAMADHLAKGVRAAKSTPAAKADKPA